MPHSYTSPLAVEAKWLLLRRLRNLLVEKVLVEDSVTR